MGAPDYVACPGADVVDEYWYVIADDADCCVNDPSVVGTGVECDSV